MMDTPTQKHGIVIVDDHPVVRDGLAQLINDTADLAVCGEAGDEAEALGVVAACNPALALVDLSLGYSSGIGVIEEIKKRFPRVCVLVLSMYDESLYAERALRAGAGGYIMKREASEKVIDAIRQVLKGEVYLSEAMRSKLLQRMVGKKKRSDGSELEQLSNRELEVLRLVGEGLSTKDIASQLKLSVKTVETHYARIKQKLDLENVRELMRRAMQWVQCPTQ
jgi:DNA-binding NarL/FixJ family response regulator